MVKGIFKYLYFSFKRGMLDFESMHVMITLDIWTQSPTF